MTEKKVILVVVLVVHLILVRLTWRDLRRRPDAAVRGQKRLWRWRRASTRPARSPTGCSGAGAGVATA